MQMSIASSIGFIIRSSRFAQVETLRTELAAAVAAREAAEGRAAAAAAAQAELQEQADRSAADLEQARAQLTAKESELKGTIFYALSYTEGYPCCPGLQGSG